MAGQIFTSDTRAVVSRPLDDALAEKFTAVAASDLVRLPIPQPDWLLSEFISKGSKCDLIAPSKCRKSFFALQLALCLASGKPFCGLPVPQARKVAYIDLELQAWALQERLRAQADALDIDDNALANLTLCPLRGQGHTLRADNGDALVEFVAAGEFDLCILDPCYKLLAPSEDENKGAGVQGILDFRDRICAESGAACLLVHHDAKGVAGDRKTTDRGSGSGWLGRDFDSRFVLTRHADGDGLHIVVSYENRNRIAPPDVTLEFNCDGLVFSPRTDIEPMAETSETAKGRRKSDEKASQNSMEFDAFRSAAVALARQCDGSPIGKDEFRARLSGMKGGAVGMNKQRTYLAALIGEGTLTETPELERRENGEVKQSRNRKSLVMLPEQRERYLAGFDALGLST